MQIQKIGLALAFSPRMQALLAEAARWARAYQAQLVLVHVGNETEEARQKLSDLLHPMGLTTTQVDILWMKGDPAYCILKACKEQYIDLLIAGALKKENFMKYYLGTTARKILRKADCSVLMLINPSVEKQSYKQLVVNAEDSAFITDALTAAFNIARQEGASWVHVAKEVKLYGLTMSALDDCTQEEYLEQRNDIMRSEIENVEKLLATLPHEGVRVNIKLLSGKSGFELAKFAQRKQADLLIIGAAPRKSFLFDRVFKHDHEYIFEDLPCNLLVVNPRQRKEDANG